MVCCRCQEEKGDEFHQGARVCKACKKIVDALSHQKHRPARLIRRKEDRITHAEWMASLKGGASCFCMDCETIHPHRRMDWDHRPGETKLFEIADMSGRAGKRQAIEEEIEKCDLICANCHRDRTHDRRQETVL